MMKRLCQVGCLLSIGLIPGICMADAGSLGGVVDLALYLIEFVAGWTVLSIVVFLLLRLRKMSNERRLAYSLMFWISPVALLLIVSVATDLYGEPGTHIVDDADRPVVLAGVTFPAGSRTEYVRLGGGFWRRKLIDAGGTQPVKLGSLTITDLRLDDSSDKTAYIELPSAQSIDGWLCGRGTYVDLTSKGPRLQSCEMGADRVIGDISWRAGTNLKRTVKGGWSLDWMDLLISSNSGVYPKAFGFPIVDMTATYSASLGLESWQGEAPDADVKVGDEYTFRGEPATQTATRLTWQPSGDMRIEGHGRSNKTGAEIACVLTHMPDNTVRPCANARG